MLTTELGLPTIATSPSSHDDRAILRLSLHAPYIQPVNLPARKPLVWSEQRQVREFASPGTN